MKAGFSRFKKVTPKAVTLPEEDLVKTRFFDGEGVSMPLVFEPAADDVDPISWAAAQRPLIEEKLLRHGALLFRGFDMDSVGKFEAFAQAICPDLFGEYGDLPAEDEGKKVYHSTPYPEDKVILFHNESSHMHQWPLKQWFYCVTAARDRGETPIVDCREIYKRLDPEVRDRFEQKALIYHRSFVEGLDVSWKSFFKTSDPSRVEDYCRKSGIDFEWQSGGGLKTRQKSPAVLCHPKTGEKIFFNQVQLHHPFFLEPEVRQSLTSMFGEDGLPRNVTYGDGTPIEDSVMQYVVDLYWRNSVQFPWQEGDVVMVDNMLVAHARNPFSGPRKIVVAMGEIGRAEELV